MLGAFALEHFVMLILLWRLIFAFVAVALYKRFSLGEALVFVGLAQEFVLWEGRLGFYLA